MKTCLIVLSCLLALVSCVPLHQVEDVEKRLPNKHMLVFNQNLTEEDIQSYLARIVAQDKVVVKNYLNALPPLRLAIVADLTESQLSNRLQEDAYLEYVEEDNVITFGQSIACNNPVRQNGATWGISRVSKRTVKQALTSYDYINTTSTSATAVHTYIIDTGVRPTHQQFVGRFRWGYNAVDSTNNDGNGHGTHVAGTISGTTYGVCKTCPVIAVKVLNAQGSGTSTQIVNGMNYVGQDCPKSSGKRCVANMSLGGSAQTTLDTAANNLFAAGVLVVVAAGNSNANADTFSPARASGSFCVGSTQLSGTGGPENQSDVRSSFSNWGPRIDIFAPGSTILSAWHTSDTATNTISGTSMASPHVAGVAAKYWMQHPQLSAAQVKANIIAGATQGSINLSCTGVCANSPNRLAWNGCDSTSE